LIRYVAALRDVKIIEHHGWFSELHVPEWLSEAQVANRFEEYKAQPTHDVDDGPSWLEEDIPLSLEMKR
jgi:hypothetical protein